MATEYKLSYTATEIDEKLGKIDNLATKNEVPTKTSQLNNDSGFITGYTETDPTVPAWAKASTKPSYTKSEVGLGNIDNVKQYSVNNPPPYPVTSVNGKTGEVALVPSDIGAEPFGLATSIVSAHNIDSVAHEDIRTQINNLFLEISDKEQLKPEFASSIEECTDTSKLYVLPDGYIYAYIMKETYAEAPNKFDPSKATLNTRHGTSSTSAYNGYFVSDYIPIDMTMASPYIMRASVSDGVAFDNLSLNRIHYFDANKSILKNYYLYDTLSASNMPRYTDDNGCAYWHIDERYATSGSSETCKISVDIDLTEVKYIRVTLGLNDASTAITVSDIADVSITFDADGGTETITGWQSTGHAFVPADYEDRIIAVEEQIDENTAKLASIGAGNVVAVSNYWEDSVSEAITKVKTLQDVGGADVVNFMWFSDMHHNTGNPYTENIGNLCATVMNSCNIPLALMNGDTMSADSVNSEATLLAWLEDAAKVLSPIGADRLMQIRGNHDDVYGSYTTGGTTNYYVNKVAPAKIWNRMHRAQAQDFRRVFGGDGTYFYLDNVPQKIRFICLNCQYYDGSAVIDGTSGQMSFGLGTVQLDWLENVALSVESGWDVVIATHVPPTAETINGRTDYLSLYGDDGNLFRSIVNNTTANVIAIFCGHCHVDAIVTGDLTCPIITITCAINTPYDGTAADRVAGTDTETAIDIVSINKATRTINMTRLGIGNDRSCTY